MQLIITTVLIVENVKLCYEGNLLDTDCYAILLAIHFT